MTHAKIIRLTGGVFCISLFLIGLGIIGQVFATTNVPVENLIFSGGYRSATVSWTYASVTSTTTGVFAVYKADDALGTAARRIALVGSDETTVRDLDCAPGDSVAYAVAYCDDRAAADALLTDGLLWSSVRQIPAIGGTDAMGAQVVTPHLGSANHLRTADTCNRCHTAHGASSESVHLLTTTTDVDEPDSRVAVCERCHAATTAIERASVTGMLASRSGHTILNTENPNGRLTCTTCHGPHQSSASGTGALTASTYYGFGTHTAAIAVDPTADNATCLPCHDDAATWYTATHTGSYPTHTSFESTASIDSGYRTYPTSGTYPGATVVSAAGNGHSALAPSGTYTAGDCRYCHSVHGSSAPYDLLRSDRGELRAMRATDGVVSDTEKTSGAYASFCLSCHNDSREGTPWSTAPDIARYVTIPAGSSDASRTAFLSSAAGHRVSSPNADVPQGSALPCYTCHNPHGSKNGNAYNLSDTLGSNLTGGRATCFACHTSSDGYVIGSDGTTYESVSDTAEIVGLSRTGTDTVAGVSTANKLKLPTGIDAHTKGAEMPCSSCHATVHAPAQATGTGDSDGKACLQCHNADEFPAALAYEFVSDGSSEATNWENGYNPHLIPRFSASMGESFVPGELLAALPAGASSRLSSGLTGALRALSASSDADTSTAVGPYCAGCHAWHTAEVGDSSTGAVAGSTSGATLRTSYNAKTASNTDYSYSAASPKLGGLCLSCHNNYLADASVGAPTQGPINSLNKLDATLFSSCFHNYTVTITRKAAAGGVASTKDKTYNANCAKCHNDADAIASPRENADKLDLKVHYVPGRRLLARFGIVADISEPAVGSTDKETSLLNYNNRGMCFGCHARKDEIAGNAGKAYSGQDWYGQQDMNSAPTAAQQTEGWTYDSSLHLAKKLYTNSSGTVIGTLTMNNEATFDDMYRLSTQTSGYPSGDGAGGNADTTANTALTAGLEVVGHQPNIPKSQWDESTLKPYIVSSTKINAIRCSDCHNVHATATGAMGTHTEWPTTKKGLVGSSTGMQGTQGNTIYADGVTPPEAIASDGSRVITLNDFWSRNGLIAQVKSVIVAWLQTSAGGGYTAAQAEDKYNEMDYNGISAQDIATAQGTTVNEGLALEWGRSVDIFCFRCHSESKLADKAHTVNSHRGKALACVECHVPTVHGGKMPGLIADRDAIPGIDGRAAGVVASGHVAMQPHQIFRWVSYDHHLTSSTQSISSSNVNVPIARLKSITPGSYLNRNSCSALASGGGCHQQGKGGGTVHWNTAD